MIAGARVSLIAYSHRQASRKQEGIIDAYADAGSSSTGKVRLRGNALSLSFRPVKSCVLHSLKSKVLR